MNLLENPYPDGLCHNNERLGIALESFYEAAGQVSLYRLLIDNRVERKDEDWWRERYEAESGILHDLHKRDYIRKIQMGSAFSQCSFIHLTGDNDSASNRLWVSPKPECTPDVVRIFLDHDWSETGRPLAKFLVYSSIFMGGKMTPGKVHSNFDTRMDRFIIYPDIDQNEDCIRFMQGLSDDALEPQSIILGIPVNKPGCSLTELERPVEGQSRTSFNKSRSRMLEEALGEISGWPSDGINDPELKAVVARHAVRHGISQLDLAFNSGYDDHAPQPV